MGQFLPGSAMSLSLLHVQFVLAHSGLTGLTLWPAQAILILLDITKNWNEMTENAWMCIGLKPSYQVSVCLGGAGVCPEFHSTDHVVHSWCWRLDEVSIRKYSCSPLRTPSALSCRLPSLAPACPFLAWATALIQGLSSCLFMVCICP